MLLEIANVKEWATIHSRCIFLHTLTVTEIDILIYLRFLRRRKNIIATGTHEGK